MRAFRALWGVLASVLLTASTEALAQKRVALVIGNSAYVNAPRLANPVNDAADMADVLTRMNFAVTQGRDLDKASMDRTIRNFAEGLAGAQMSLFFYAGHGLQVNGQNYLVPIDAKLTSATAIDFETVRLDLVQRSMERGTVTNILFLDACRDNPLARNLARTLGTRTSALGKGLAPMESGEGTLISFSTQPGNVASDGTDRNSPFAGALIKHIATPGEDLPTILINVRNDVMAATARNQVPWEHSALTAKVYFIAPSPSQTGPSHEQQVELAFWLSVKDSNTPEVLRAYLDRYPRGSFSAVAVALIDHYEQQAKAAAAARETQAKIEEEKKKALEVKRIEDESRTQEALLGEARAKAESAKDQAETKRVADKARVEQVARAEQLRKALEEANRAREAAKAAEVKRQAVAKAAEEATKAAEQLIATKREKAKPDEIKVATLPKLEKPAVAANGLEGTWEGGAGRVVIIGGKVFRFRWAGKIVKLTHSAVNANSASFSSKTISMQMMLSSPNTASGNYKHTSGRTMAFTFVRK